MGMGMDHQTEWFGQNGVAHGNGQYSVDTPLYYGDSLSSQFEPSESDMLGNNPFPGQNRWSRQGGQ